MTQPRLELITVAGYEKGQRAVLMENDCLLGRARKCQIQFMEPYVSRHQARLCLMPDGWMIENLSPTPIAVNGKKLPEGRKAFLETGDVIRLGLLTEVLFVDAGHDPEAAIIAYERLYPAPVEPLPVIPLPPSLVQEFVAPAEAAPVPGEPVLFAPAGSKLPGAKISAPARATRPAATGNGVTKMDVLDGAEISPVDEEALLELVPVDTDEVTVSDVIAEERKAKIKKYAIAFGIYLAALVALVVILKVAFGGEKEDTTAGKPQAYTEEEIDSILRTKYPDRELQPGLAASHLTKAREYFVTRKDTYGWYLAIEYYRLAEAHGGTQGTYTLSVADENNYITAVEELVDRVWPRYDQAMRLANDKQWRRAEEILEELLQYLPRSPEATEDHELRANIQAHLNYVNHELHNQ